jgi:hypothetical protein
VKEILFFFIVCFLYEIDHCLLIIVDAEQKQRAIDSMDFHDFSFLLQIKIIGN